MRTLAVLLCVIGGCAVPDGDRGGGGPPLTPSDSGEHDWADGEWLWPQTPEPVLTVAGGLGHGPDGVGAGGGELMLTSAGRLAIEAAEATPQAPMPEASAAGDAMAAVDCMHDVSRTGSIRFGEITIGGADAIRTITSTGGDIVVDGLLRTADLGDRAQSLVLRAPAGTVFIEGRVDAAPADGIDDGDRGGAVTIVARQVVLRGTVVTAGEPGGTAGAGGAGGRIAIRAEAGGLWIAGALVSGGGSGPAGGGAAGPIELEADRELVVAVAVDARGGDAVGRGPLVAGPGGDISLVAGGDLALSAPIRLRGGAALTDGADARGGAAGTLRVDAEGAVRIAATIDGRGGPARARSAGGAVRGGRAGAIVVGEELPPARIDIAAPLAADGGRGGQRGGRGGTVVLSAVGGDLVLAEPLTFSGGDSLRNPGDAGIITASAGPDAGGLRLRGEVVGRGGHAEPDGDGPAAGGLGAEVWLEVLSDDGPALIAPAARLLVDGGRATGTGRGGGGGAIDLRTRDGAVSMAGQLLARGGQAELGTGGTGGILNLWTDTNHDGLGGDLTVEPAGLIDVSGGDGATGGSCRNNGTYGIAHFPDQQEQIAVLLNSETVWGPPTDGRLQNLGRVLARGGAPGGWGGDVMFHGRRPDGTEDPLPGWQDLTAGAGGADGDFVAE